jgi:predicted helicase
MTSFDQLHVLNLHGNSLKKEKSPDGSKDENVFDIMQGVAIILAVKRKNVPKGIWYSDLWGTRDSKYSTLDGGQMTQTSWQELTPRGDKYLFVPQDATLAAEYEQWPKVTDIFPVSSVGIVTARDDFAVGFDTSVLKNRLEMLLNLDVRDEELRESLGLKDTGTWKLARAREEIRKDPHRMESVVPILYRPFDMRWFIYHDAIIERARRDVMSQLLPASRNLAIVVPRRVETKGDWQHCFIADAPVDHVAVSLKTIDTVLPLFRFNPDEGSIKPKDDMRAVDAWAGSPNVDRTIWDSLGSNLGFKPTPEQLFGYVYAVLYSLAYRKRYAEFLKSDFPRIPFTKDRDTFLRLGDLGQQLIDLHLMRSPELDNPISRFCGKGDGAVTKVEYDANRGRVNINPTQYFDGVTPDLWSYQIGGYQVLSKWLDYRKGRLLTSADTIHYSRIVTALAGTVTVEGRIDTCTVHMWNLAQP